MFTISSAWNNVNVAKNSVSACLQNFLAIARTVPEKKVHESDRFTIADIEGTISPVCKIKGGTCASPGE
jgi:hypothetical protein